MAVSKNMLEKNLVLEYQDGLDEKGKAIMKGATYKNVKLTADPEALMMVVDAINPLMPEGISEARVVENYVLLK
ncbi:DUF1659 domain-containing protein [Clostridium botulinum]|uniref:DUF1659 domain-containing protein n=1 Tax=Clostridium botulinum (strain Langeland / NCTC 10281 / Type F) TaxID=441772 RepID=A7GJR0_CLOBL|nr:DUF1659 domain-containing protein [Clostridium botulinum]HDR5605925.1 DUF1659 domain-containing protein [Bacillus anthracis]ABS42936.1 conserved hypothetical protein [Clostridium botulinum F str. Langeland]ADG01373.1 hypothetical protein CBF_P0017 [Clostridium botulinum F str. 230613]APQ98754.1 hypothetical protein RSJ3_3753 [Clostridium botulinum]AUN12740.1 hypothetical protein RSJ6_20045 [Clostridium botulinum]